MLFKKVEVNYSEITVKRVCLWEETNNGRERKRIAVFHNKLRKTGPSSIHNFDKNSKLGN